MKTLFSKNWPAIIIFLSWFIFAYPFFLQNKAPYPAVYQNSFFTPWRDYPKYALPVKNNALSDVVDEIYPWKHFTIEELKKGNIPWWNPYSFSGNPHLADFQTAVFSPFNLLFFILPFIDAWSLLILLQPLLAGLFMQLLLRKLKISKEGALLGSITFMFAGFLVTWMPYGTLSMSIAFLPLALFAVEKNFEKTHLFSLLLLPISLAVSFFSGHFQTSLYLSAFVFIFIIFRSLISRNFKSSIYVLLFYFLGIIISLFQIIPSLEIYNNSVRSGLFSNEGGIPLYYLITTIAPDFFGNPVTRNDWLGNYAEWASFIGIVPLLLSAFSLFQKKKSNIFFFLTAGLCAILLAMNSPLQSILSSLKLPVFSTSIPSRIIVIFSFSFSVLAGFGLDNLKKLLEQKKVKKIIFPILILLSFTIFIWLLLFIFKILPEDKALIAARNFVIPTILLIVASAMIILKLIIKRNINIRIILICFLLITLFDSLRFAQKWVPFDQKNLVFPDLPVITAMQKNIGFGRVFGKLGSYIDTYYHLPSVEGYDPLYIKRYGEFLASASTGTYQPAVRSLAVLDKKSKYAGRVLDLLGVTVIFHVIGDTGKDWAYPVWKKNDQGQYLYSVIYHDDIFQLYDNSTALPRAKLFYDYEIIKQDKDIIKRFYSSDFDFRNKLILEEDPGISSSVPLVDRESKAEITSYTPNKIIIDVNSPQPGLLFLSDNYYPAWKAKVNGQASKIFRTDYTLRSVIVPSGKSKVEFYYDSGRIIFP